MYCIIVAFSKWFDDKWLTYKIPDSIVGNLKVWHYVTIPFWKDEIDWICIEILDNISIDFDVNKIKDLISIKFDYILLNNYQIELLKFLSYNYFTLIHNCLNLFFPKNLRGKLMKWKFEFSENIKNYNFNQTNILNDSQRITLEKINISKNNKVLLYWVTWSWKTEIYIQLIKDTLEKDKQSLLLIPEIILSSQLALRIKTVFWDDVELINSSITEANKTKIYNNIYTWNSKIIVWTRSALFYPYNNLWLIIMDEEHDNSYISDNSPRYKSLDIIEKISDLNNIKVLFWSWTPSIETMYKWVKWDYELINLLEEY